ncbi:MAG: hypothetical protein KatS3mg082_3130 [Nitrospiraceae bacterium]|nr:MAG: hypothetical protein KatS3mg082_3130 [Nitrospiraceae bacterium]
MRLAILTTHPIQYQAPWFRALARHPRLELEVLFCHRATPQDQAAAGFGVPFDWDVPLLDGYPHRFLLNAAKRPGVTSFWGLDTPEIAGLVSRGQYDAVLVNGWHYKAAWQAIAACWRTKTPLLVRGDSQLAAQSSPVKKVVKRLFYPRFIRRFDACLAVGERSREYFLHYGARPERIFLVPHVVDAQRMLDACSRLRARRPELRRRWGLAEEAVVFLFIGKFIEKKRPIDFVVALTDAHRRNPRVAGLMVGDGPLRTLCEAFVREHRSPVVFAGFLNQSEIALAYLAADAIVLPSGSETWGIVVNEAMVCGRPAFVSDRVGCGPDLVLPGKTGAVYPFGDAAALARLILRYSENPSRLTEMGRAARARVLSRNSVDAAVQGVVSALEAVGRPARGATPAMS